MWILALMILARPIDAASPAGCDFYAAPDGSGNGNSEATASQIADFWRRASAGKTLCLLDGSYVGTPAMIAPPPGLKGSAGSPITVRALHDGKVLIDGEDRRTPVHLVKNDWFVVEGINACCSNDTVIGMDRSNHNVIRRVAAWDAADSNDFIFGIHYGEHNLLEDVAGWGIARKIFSSSQKGDFTTIRRAWGRWEGSHVVGPKSVYDLAYNNHDMIVENSIGTWSGEKLRQNYVLLDYSGKPWSGKGAGRYTDYQVDQPYAIFDIGVSQPDAHARLLGSLAYVQTRDRFQPDRLVYATKIAFATVDNTVAYIEAGANRSTHTFGLYGALPGSNLATNLSGFGGAGFEIGAGWQTANTLQGPSPRGTYPPGENVFHTRRGARLCYQYRDGTLTGEPLWPWPMNQRIRDAMIQSGRQAVDVTATIETLFGPIPEECRQKIVEGPSTPAESRPLPRR